jgi:RNA polymerase II subunit A small phosphatase-like protein
MPDKLIILDLDETLIHATPNKLDIVEDFVFDKYFVYKRPFLDQFLFELSSDFKVGIWSSADDEYVEAIVKTITPPGMIFEMTWGRSRCSYRRDMEQDTYIHEKRLEKLKKHGFRLEQILIVDDTREKSRTNYGNAVHIKEFIGDKGDDELEHLLIYLRTLKGCENVRTIEKRGWRKGSSF